MSRHRAEARPRYGRIGVLGLSVVVTTVAVLGASGVLPATLSGGQTSAAVARDPAPTGVPAPSADRAPEPEPEPAAEAGAQRDLEAGAAAVAGRALPGTVEPEVSAESVEVVGSVEAGQSGQSGDESLPAGSGTGRRVVFSEGRQRVWLVDRAGRVVRTYPVSGSVYDNLDPGTYEVYSRSEDAVGIDDSGTMKWFVRFTQGPSGAAIGFHTIPVDDGGPVQTAAELGTPLSHGCIRQRTADARALWSFAPLGTTVVVTP